MISVHHGSDTPSRDEIRKNLASLAQAAKALGDGRGTVLSIFPEGKNNDDLQVTMVRTGAARLAMPAMPAMPAGVPGWRIVPVGLNYERKDRFRSAGWIHVGEPINADVWRAAHENERATIRALTPKIDRRMKAVAIQLENAAWASVLAEVEGLLPASRGLNLTSVLQLRRRVAEAINYFHAHDLDRATAVATAVADKGGRARRASGLPADARFFRRPLVLRMFGFVTDAIKFLAGMGLAIPGLLHHLIPHGVTR